MAFSFGQSTNTNPSGGNTNAQQPLLGQSTQTSGLFGNLSQQQQQQQGQSVMQLPQSTQPTFSWSTNTPTHQTMGFQMSMAEQQPVPNSQYGPAQPPSIEEQLIKIKNAWDTSHPDCAFQHYFYNKVPVEQALLYSKPPQQSQEKWDEAVANRPDNSVVPVLAVGFNDVKKRVALQEQQVQAYRSRMHEIVNKLTELQHKHDLSTVSKLAEIKSRHSSQAHRALILACRVQVLKNRGYALQPEEEKLRINLEKLAKQVSDPQVFGRMNEVWARMARFRSREKVAQERSWGVTIDWGNDEAELSKVIKVLKDQQAGLGHITNILKDDLEQVEVLLRGLEEKYSRLTTSPDHRDLATLFTARGATVSELLKNNYQAELKVQYPDTK